jgi:hypothetical protein
MEEVRDDDVDPAVIAGVRAELARLGYTDVPDEVIMNHVKSNITRERARVAPPYLATGCARCQGSR